MQEFIETLKRSLAYAEKTENREEVDRLVSKLEHYVNKQLWEGVLKTIRKGKA